MIKKIKLIGREHIIDPNTNEEMDDNGLYALNGIKETIIEINDEKNVEEQVSEFLDNNPDWENYPHIEINEL